MPLIIEAGRSERHYWHDLWKYRELFAFLAWRDVLVRYKQTVVGVAWAFLQPALTIAILSVVFGMLAKMPSGDLPYPLLVAAGAMPWQLFANILNTTGNSLVSNAGLISKIYFPRMIVPGSAVVVGLVDFLIQSLILALLLVWYGIVPDPRILLVPLFLGVGIAFAFGTGLWVSALMVRYRDFRVILPFFIQFGVYVSPVGWKSDLVPEHLRPFYYLNPMAGVIDGFRWALFGEALAIYWPGFAISLAVIAAILASGVWYFRKTERTFADII